ncbi:hypothetical protein scyTo_0009143 [Scyliorhinus torazame]|uniref:Uncharacterized protein n=1 Tax=Scyliorhinus torazame TaxID=75743 RepID=A0A401NHA5_SCYTO|nr:hypothetical protein [Scyliorhinus torazame]
MMVGEITHTYCTHVSRSMLTQNSELELGFPFSGLVGAGTGFGICLGAQHRSRVPAETCGSRPERPADSPSLKVRLYKR